MMFTRLLAPVLVAATLAAGCAIAEGTGQTLVVEVELDPPAERPPAGRHWVHFQGSHRGHTWRASTTSDSNSVALAALPNPLNHPDDARLNAQYSDLMVFLRTNDLSCFSFASMTAFVSVGFDQATRARELLRRAMSQNSNRWDQIEFNLKGHPTNGWNATPLRPPNGLNGAVHP